MSPSLVTGAQRVTAQPAPLKPIGTVAKNVLVDLGGPLSPFESKDALSGGIALNSSTLMIRALCFRRCYVKALLRHSMASDSGWLKACAPTRRSWNNRSALCVQHKPLSVKRLEPGHVFEVQRIR